METENPTAVEVEEEKDPIYRRAEWVVSGASPVRIKFAPQETGWAYDMGDGKYRLANTPIYGAVGQRVEDLPQWGDLVSIRGGTDELKYLEIHEKFDDTAYVIPEDEYLAFYRELQTEVRTVDAKLDAAKDDKDSDAYIQADHQKDEYLDQMDEVWDRLSDDERSSLDHHRPEKASDTV